MSATPLPSPPPPRSPWQRFYGFAHRLRRNYWASRAEGLDRPVLSVGNLHWGGAGKTPLVAAVAAHLRDGGRRVAILSRGYRGEGKGVRVVSHGEGPLLGPRQAGDEPVFLAGQLPGVAVVVGRDRRRAGQHALARLSPPPEIFVLDDGFSHLPLRRDLDLLVFPSADPFAGGRLPPSGRLREPLAASSRADAAVLTGSPRGTALHATGEDLAQALRPHGFTGPGFASRSVNGAAQLAEGGELGTRRVLVVSAIARPEVFARSVRAAGLSIAGELRFGDHHPYPAASLEKIRRAFTAHDAGAVLTTGKDLVKLRGRLDLPLAELPLNALPERAFFDWLDSQLAKLASS